MMIPVLHGVIDTADPTSGDGWPESVILVIMVGALVYMNVSGIEPGSTFQQVITLVCGYFFGKHAVEHEREEAAQDE